LLQFSSNLVEDVQEENLSNEAQAKGSQGQNGPEKNAVDADELPDIPGLDESGEAHSLLETEAEEEEQEEDDEEQEDEEEGDEEEDEDGEEEDDSQAMDEETQPEEEIADDDNVWKAT
jgi:hypothetical protein